MVSNPSYSNYLDDTFDSDLYKRHAKRHKKRRSYSHSTDSRSQASDVITVHTVDEDNNKVVERLSRRDQTPTSTEPQGQDSKEDGDTADPQVTDWQGMH